FCAEAHAEAPPSAAEPLEGAQHRLVWRRRVIPLLSGENVIGRDRASAVWINDESVSRRHARVVVGEDGAWLEDLGSKNGTYVRGKPVRAAVRLEDGEEFTVGQVVGSLRYHCEGTSSTTRTARQKGGGRGVR